MQWGIDHWYFFLRELLYVCPQTRCCWQCFLALCGSVLWETPGPALWLLGTGLRFLHAVHYLHQSLQGFQLLCVWWRFWHVLHVFFSHFLYLWCYSWNINYRLYNISISNSNRFTYKKEKLLHLPIYIWLLYVQRMTKLVKSLSIL